MTLASHYVLKDMLNSLGDIEEAKKVFKKFCSRYSDDIELMDICKAFNKYIKSKDSKSLEDIKRHLKELVDGRSIDTGGGERLWYKNRRPGMSA